MSASVSAFQAERFSLAIAEMELSVVRLAGLTLQIDHWRNELTLAIEQLKILDQHWTRARLRCTGAVLTPQQMVCRNGQLVLNGEVLPLSIDFDVDPGARNGTLALIGRDGSVFRVRLSENGVVEAELANFPLSALEKWIPFLTAWSVKGAFDGQLHWRPGTRFMLDGVVHNGHFSTQDGSRAAEKLSAVLKLDSTRHSQSPAWEWSSRIEWREGAAYWQPIYLEAGPVLEAKGLFDGTLLSVTEAHIALESGGQLAATARFDVTRGQLTEAALALADADLSMAGPLWITPLLAPARSEQLHYSGRFSAGIQVKEGELVAFDTVFDNAGLRLDAASGGREITFGPINGFFPWRRDGVIDIELDIGGGRWERLELGAFHLAARAEDGAVNVPRTRIPLLDGAVVLESLSLQREPAGWTGRGSITMEPVSVSLLTEALGLPVMNGRLSASIPGLRVSPGELELEGALVISVFGGFIQATGLRILEPFGVASHLEADIIMRHLDLEELTQTFDFGEMSGFVDMDVTGLKLAKWIPVRFNAHLYSSPGSYPRRISQRAVQNITALGGAGAVAAIQRSLLGFFETFRYRELGLRCVLEGGVCTMEGIERRPRHDGGFMLIDGGGLPALDVIGYNQRIDWRELISRIRRVTDSNTKAEVHSGKAPRVH